MSKGIRRGGADLRVMALRRFALAISVFNLIGHLALGFEQAYAHPLIALVTAYLVELGLEWIDARSRRRVPRFQGHGWIGIVDFLLPAHITGLACSMLLYSNQRLAPMAFATAVALVSKRVLRLPMKGSFRHVFNPSNLGITVTLLIFPWVGIAQPYMFTENVYGRTAWIDWLVPLVIVTTGTLLNMRLTKRLPLIVAWVSGFVVQAVLRAAIFETPLASGLAPVTGVAFVLFTFYMVTDPATTPWKPRAQVVFGASVAAAYGLLMTLHIVFGLFFALTLICTLRGLFHALVALRDAWPAMVATPVAEISQEP